jgi:hypothetical protein
MFGQAAEIDQYVVILLLYSDGNLPWQLGSAVLSAIWFSFRAIIICTLSRLLALICARHPFQILQLLLMCSYTGLLGQKENLD